MSTNVMRRNGPASLAFFALRLGVYIFSSYMTFVLIIRLLYIN